MKVHKSKAKKVDGHRYRQIVLCKPDFYLVPINMNHSYHWENVTCKDCLKIGNRCQ